MSTKAFMSDDYLLKNEWAKKLYNSYAKHMPIFDYHCHLPAKDIWEDVKFESLTDAWLSGDHYKWRLMRAAGIAENYITGDAPPYEKFIQFVRSINQAPKNPVYHWAHRELSAYFGVKEPLTEKNAHDIYEKAGEMLKKYSARSVIKQSNVKALFTTDDPIDNLDYHEKLRNDSSFDVIVAPAFRPDKAFNIDTPDFVSYVEALAKSRQTPINSFWDFADALSLCLDDFIKLGAKASDHSFPLIPYALSTEDEINSIFAKALSNEPLTCHEVEMYKTRLLTELAVRYKNKGIVMELHIGALRNQNTQMFKKIGADTGFDVIHDSPVTYKLGRLLDLLNECDALPKTIVFPLNPADFVPVSALLGCFTSDEPGRVQLGAAWWHNDHVTGIQSQLNAYATTSALGTFAGMLTDSRSFFSYERHDYFRRILCDFIGECIENGEFVPDMDICGTMVENICFNNAANYFGLKLPAE